MNYSNSLEITTPFKEIDRLIIIDTINLVIESFNKLITDYIDISVDAHVSLKSGANIMFSSLEDMKANLTNLSPIARVHFTVLYLNEATSYSKTSSTIMLEQDSSKGVYKLIVYLRSESTALVEDCLKLVKESYDKQFLKLGSMLKDQSESQKLDIEVTTSDEERKYLKQSSLKNKKFSLLQMVLTAACSLLVGLLIKYLCK